MAIIHVNAGAADFGVGSPWNRNTVIAPQSTPLALLDADGNDSGVVFTNTSVPVIGSGASGASPSTLPVGWPDLIIRTYWDHNVAGESIQFKLSGLLAGQAFNLSIACWAYSNNRPTDVVVNGSTSQKYVTSTTTANDPLVFSGIADGSGEINVTLSPDPSFTYFTGFILETLAVSDSVTPTETDYSYGDTITLSTSLAGSITATLTDSASNVLSLTKISDTQFTIPSLSGGQSTVLSETGVQLEVDNGTDTAIAAIEITPPAGYAATVLTSIVDRALIETDWIFGFDTPAVIGDQSFEDSGIVTHNVDGTSTFTSDGTYTYFTIQASSGLVSEITKTVGAEPPISDTNYIKPIVTSIENTIISTAINLLTR